MKRYASKSADAANDARRIERRAFLGALLSGGVCVLDGCALFDKSSTAKKKEKETEAEKSAFESEREKQENLSDFVSKTGRNGKEKRDVSRGETFLMSNKAREIYANTER